jgi:hypothetical protein
MGKANLFGMIMIILCINIVLYTAGVRVVSDEGQNVMEQFIDSDAYTDEQRLQLADSYVNSVPRSFENSGSGGLLSFIDNLRAVKGFVLFMVNIIFTPIGLFANLPSAIGLMVGLPLTMGAVISLIYFIRSGA